MTTTPDSKDDRGSIGLGLFMGLGLNVMLFFLALGTGLAQVFLAALFLIGLTQLLYVVPMCVYYQKTGRRNTAKGLIIAAAITALLNATCWGWVSTIRF